jgi:hypothetical protein
MNPQKNKGDKAEREACALLTEFTPYEVERRFGAGMENDKGSITKAKRSRTTTHKC